MNRRVALLLQAVVVLAGVGLLVAQTVAIPALSGWMADAHPEFAWARWPLAVSLVLFLACIQVALLATWQLLGQVADEEIFNGSARRWVDLIIAALGAAWIVALATSLWQTSQNVSAPWIVLTETLGLLVGLAVLLLLVVLRGLLIQATELKIEMDAVV